MAEKIEGYIEHVVYRNQDNGYTVLTLSSGGNEITCVGTMQEANQGEYLEAEGEYTFHPTYGQQFRAETTRVVIPRTGVALERYLGSGAIKGVGKALAKRIIRKFGEDTMEILEEQPERLAEIKGISESKAQDIGEQIEEKSQMQNALIFLAQYGIPFSLSVKIYNQYQDKLYQVLRENPYKLAEDIRGVGFLSADKIAAKVGISPDSEFRIRSGILYTLNQASGQGHMYLPEKDLLARTKALLGEDPGDLEQYLMDLSIDKKIVVKEEAGTGEEPERLVYTAHAYYTELNTARMLQNLNVEIHQDQEKVEQKIRKVEEESSVSLDELQRQAVTEAAGHGVFILTGGPGTGKTTTINTMIRYFASENLSIALAAPTGRAAKRMTEATGYEASTIHRLLELAGMPDDSSEEAQFERNQDNPLEQDVIIIDEMSMVDIYLMHSLLLAIVPGTRLILVGDRNQLPSVGPGSVLRDLIRSKAFPVVTLNKIFRQAQESDIIVNAHRINAGLPVRTDNKSKDFFFLRRNDSTIIMRVVLALVQDKLPRYVHANPEDIQVLTPMRKGALGVVGLNQMLQKYLNPAAPGKREKETAQGLFREGDKVMQIRNDYQLVWEVRGKYGIAAQTGLGVFNGDMGIIQSIDEQNETLTVAFEEGKMVDYTFRQLDELELAYATTVHKSQGSEYPAVVIPLLGVPPMLRTRNLLYTAVTRARKCVILVGSLDTFQEMIDNPIEENRYTTLDRRIEELGQEE